MKQKKTNLILSCLVLIAALFAELYCFLEFRNDLLMVLGTGVIILVSAYLAMDSALSLFLTEKNRQAEKGENPDQGLKKQLAEIEKVQKALYLLLRKNADREKKQLELLSNETKQQKDSMVKVGKLIVKYNQENTEKTASLLRELIGKPDFDESRILQALENGVQSVNEHLDKLAEGLEEVREEIGDVEKKIRDISVLPTEKLPAEDKPDNVLEETTEVETVENTAELIPESEPIQEPEPVPEIDTSDPNKMMNPDDIAALLASMGEEEPPQSEPLPEAKPEPIPEPEPVPEIDTGDPNKMMSPDDIAALLASMGQ